MYIEGRGRKHQHNYASRAKRNNISTPDVYFVSNSVAIIYNNIRRVYISVLTLQ